MTSRPRHDNDSSDDEEQHLVNLDHGYAFAVDKDTADLAMISMDHDYPAKVKEVLQPENQVPRPLERREREVGCGGLGRHGEAF